jgi:hypothetical protein
MLTGETLSFVLTGLLANKPNLPILAMGDFNDDPFNRSLQEYLIGSRDPGLVKRSPLARLLNLMWPLMQGDKENSANVLRYADQIYREIKRELGHRNYRIDRSII